MFFVQLLSVAVADLGRGTHITHILPLSFTPAHTPKLQLSHACSQGTDPIWTELPRQSQHLPGSQHCVLARSAEDLVEQ